MLHRKDSLFRLKVCALNCILQCTVLPRTMLLKLREMCYFHRKQLRLGGRKMHIEDPRDHAASNVPCRAGGTNQNWHNEKFEAQTATFAFLEHCLCVELPIAVQRFTDTDVVKLGDVLSPLGRIADWGIACAHPESKRSCCQQRPLLGCQAD